MGPTVAATAFSGSTFKASLERARQSFAGALRIQPQVIPAADPIRLDSQPAQGDTVAAELHYHAGRVFEAQNSFAAAAAHYRDALARSPQDVKLLASYARVQDRLGNVREADSIYRRAIELDPNNASCHNDLAMCHARHGNLDVAVGTLQRAIRLDANNQLYRNNLALVLVDAGRVDEAFQQLTAVHEEAVAHYNLGYMLLERNVREGAAAHFQRALALNPRLEVARQMLDDLQRSTAQTDGAFGAAAAPNASGTPATHPSLTRLPRAAPASNLAGGFGDAVR